ncbi:MAG: hypothetical protein JRH20_26210, partial [Deltaproteobacteria bacterium]|nr:hypothetical protein [Deltaproteobacteria bacterium]
SARRVALYDPDPNLDVLLGPLRSFRCFRQGIHCDQDANTLGDHTGCRPAYDWLHTVDDYALFFSALKPPGWVLMASIAGPHAPVRVGDSLGFLELQSSCPTQNSSQAVPGLRIKALVDRFWGPTTSICEDDFGPALQQIGELVSL